MKRSTNNKIMAKLNQIDKLLSDLEDDLCEDATMGVTTVQEIKALARKIVESSLDTYLSKPFNLPDAWYVNEARARKIEDKITVEA